jgi:hypothetical protein
LLFSSNCLPLVHFKIFFNIQKYDIQYTVACLGNDADLFLARLIINIILDFK